MLNALFEPSHESSDGEAQFPRGLAIIGLLRPFGNEQPLNAADAAPMPDAMFGGFVLSLTLCGARLVFFFTGLLNEDDPGLGVSLAPARSVFDLGAPAA